MRFWVGLRTCGVVWRPSPSGEIFGYGVRGVELGHAVLSAGCEKTACRWGGGVSCKVFYNGAIISHISWYAFCPRTRRTYSTIVKNLQKFWARGRMFSLPFFFLHNFFKYISFEDGFFWIHFLLFNKGLLHLQPMGEKKITLHEKKIKKKTIFVYLFFTSLRAIWYAIRGKSISSFPRGFSNFTLISKIPWYRTTKIVKETISKINPL